MSLFLAEATIQGISDKQEFQQLLEKIPTDEVNIVEVQVVKDLTRAYFILEAIEAEKVKASLNQAHIQPELVKEVRLIGKSLEEVKNRQDQVNYLVEWEIPAEITMDQYLARKKKNSVHYQEVPDVAFSRTYVCEDTSKCLCFYDAPNEAAVKRAREAVKAPITSLNQLAD